MTLDEFWHETIGEAGERRLIGDLAPPVALVRERPAQPIAYRSSIDVQVVAAKPNLVSARGQPLADAVLEAFVSREPVMASATISARL